MKYREYLEKWMKVGKEASAQGPIGPSATAQLALAALHGAGDVQGQVLMHDKRIDVTDDKIHRLEVRLRELELRHE